MGKNILALILLAVVSSCSQLTPTTSTPVDKSSASCSSSAPNVKDSPHLHFVSQEVGYQNADGTLYTNLPEQGRLVLDSVSVQDDGSLGPIIWRWYLEDTFGQLEVKGRKLDEPSTRFEGEFVNSSRTDQGFTGPQETRIEFPGPGCWQITAETGDAEIELVVFVAVEGTE